jgi:ERCC4-type nuclease
MDERERHDIRDEMQNLPCELIIETYPVADFIIGPGVGIERKRGDDFTASLCDNRFFRQLFNLSQQFAKPILLLENFSLMFTRQILTNALYGALLYVAHKWNVCIIPTKDSQDTALTLWSLARNYQKDLPENQPFTYTPQKEVVPPVTRQDQLDFLEGLLKVSIKNAETLLAQFHTPQNVLQALLTSEIILTKKGKKKLMGSFAQIKGFGIKFVETNRNLITQHAGPNSSKSPRPSKARLSQSTLI